MQWRRPWFDSWVQKIPWERDSLPTPVFLECRRPQFDSWVGKIPWRRDKLPSPVFLGFSGGSAGKESTRNAGDPSSIPELGRSPGEGKGYPLQYSGPENSRDYTVPGVAKSLTGLSGFHFHFPALASGFFTTEPLRKPKG